jgi:hypothetical protein
VDKSASVLMYLVRANAEIRNGALTVMEDVLTAHRLLFVTELVRVCRFLAKENVILRGIWIVKACIILNYLQLMFCLLVKSTKAKIIKI